ncbi:MAG: nucleoside triphosphate pyrophosphohydrolase [Candidatus Saccharibacteria bacterium]|nr:nucleoside triphosphate pyrophosphohydrolase [Candidatus Saccharibacteria bacterium]
MKHNKLVRDNIPDIILADGHEVSTRILNDKEYKAELEKKLMEECKEVLGSEGEHRLEELGDVLEVMMALAKLDNYYMDDIVVAARKKREKRGGFDKKIFLIEEK